MIGCNTHARTHARTHRFNGRFTVKPGLVGFHLILSLYSPVASPGSEIRVGTGGIEDGSLPEGSKDRAPVGSEVWGQSPLQKTNICKQFAAEKCFSTQIYKSVLHLPYLPKNYSDLCESHDSRGGAGQGGPTRGYATAIHPYPEHPHRTYFVLPTPYRRSPLDSAGGLPFPRPRQRPALFFYSSSSDATDFDFVGRAIFCCSI